MKSVKVSFKQAVDVCACGLCLLFQSLLVEFYQHAFLHEPLISLARVLQHAFPSPSSSSRVPQLATIWVFHAGDQAKSACVQAGAEVCLTVTLLDGLVLARAGIYHSANSRSVMVLGKAEAVTDPGSH